MNNKLRHFPEFAAGASVDSVSNCEQARALFAHYVEYSEQHPNFDEDEPLELPDLPIPADPGPMPASGTKIKNGTGDRLSPVVGLYNFQSLCTGTFIAKNWVMTAAHCLWTAPGFTPGTSPIAAAKIFSWVKYDVSFAGPGGVVPGDVRSYPKTLQWIDPRYMGFKTGVFTAAFDFALLYFHQDYDGDLPNNLPDQSASTVPYMRISLSLAVNTASSSMWGFGLPGLSTLERGNANAYTITASVGTSDGETFKAPVPSGTQPFICHGDSGGPLVDRYDIDPGTGVPQPQYVAAGTLSTWSPGTTGDCADTTGLTVWWVRNENERDFIGQTVNQYYPLFLCNEKQSASASGFPDYMECWGKPCKADGECAADEFCMRPGSQLKSCRGCSSGGCDCIYGQCMEKPVK